MPKIMQGALAQRQSSIVASVIPDTDPRTECPYISASVSSGFHAMGEKLWHLSNGHASILPTFG